MSAVGSGRRKITATMKKVSSAKLTVKPSGRYSATDSVNAAQVPSARDVALKTIGLLSAGPESARLRTVCTITTSDSAIMPSPYQLEKKPGHVASSPV